MSSSTNRCIIIDNQNCDQDEISRIKAKFKTANFEIEPHKNVTTSDMEILLMKCYKQNKVEDLSCLVVCIFSDNSSDTPTDKAFRCANNESFRVDKFANLISTKNGVTSYAHTYILINDKNGTQNADDNQFHLLYQTSNVYLSFNTHPDSLFVQRLCTSLRIDDESQCNYEQCQTLQEIGHDISQTIEHSLDQDFFRTLSETIFKFSTNAAELIGHSIPTNSGDLEYDYRHPSNGMCLILNFDKKLKSKGYLRRRDTENDVQMLAETFQHLGFNVYAIDEFVFDEVIKFVTGFDHSLSNCLVLCLIYPYSNVKEFGAYLEAIFQLFNPSLSAKPKILLIHNPYENAPSNAINYLNHLSAIPKHFLVVFSSYLNENQNNNFGYNTSNFIQTLHNVVKSFLNKYDFLTMIQMAIFGIQRHSYKHKNVPSIVIKSTLKRLFFIKSDHALFYPIKTSVTIEMISPTITYSKKLSEKDLLSRFYKFKIGRCLLFDYEPGSVEQSGHQVTKDNKDSLKKAFQELNFEVDELNCSVSNGNSISKWEILRKESQKNYQHYDCLVVFVFPNGNPDAIIDRDKLFNYFAVKDLVEKPKLFFVLGSSQIESPESDDTDTYSNGINQRKRPITIPKYSNFLYFYCDKVSKAVNILCSELSANSSRLDLNAALSNVLKQLKQDTRDETVCYLNSTLTQLISFKPEYSFVENINKPITSIKRGICYIFSIYELKDSKGNVIPEKTRLGNKFDVENLQTFFGVFLNFELKVKSELDSNEMAKELEKIYNEDFSSYGSFVMCYLSHGSYDGLLKCHQGETNRDDLIRSVSSNRSLNNKPKMVFIQACQGGLKFEDMINDIEIDGQKLNYETHKWNYPDIFVFTGSYPGYVSFRNPQMGSYFIRALCETLKLYHYDCDLATIAALVCNTIGYFTNDISIKVFVNGKEKQKRVKQIPFLHSTMREPIELSKYKRHSLIRGGACVCYGHPIQTVEHVLLHCPKYSVITKRAYDAAGLQCLSLLQLVQFPSAFKIFEKVSDKINEMLEAAHANANYFKP